MKKALEIEPVNGDVLFGLAEIYMFAGKSASTTYVADKLMEIDPLNPTSLIMKASFFIDTDIKEGLSFFEKAYQLDPENLITQWMLAYAYFWCEKKELAYPLIAKLKLAAPDWAFTRQILFLAHGLKGEKVLAIQYATADLETEASDDRHFAFHLSECYAVIGETEKALDLLAYSMELFYPYRFLSTNPLYVNICKEERFLQLMEKGKGSRRRLKFNFSFQ